MKAFTLLLVPVLSAVSASAHGILTGFGINGAPQSREVIRQVSSQDPNYGAGNPALTCGPNARNAGQSASVKPGDTLTFDWRTSSGSPWPHNTGPMLTYMASCGDGPCSQFNAAGAQWFKIDQVGRKDGGAWFQQDLMSGAPASVRLPNVAPGNYLIRHEVIALHLAGSPQGAEFYPGCVQVQVTGAGTGRPANGETRTFPGGYSDNDPGILVNAFDARTPYAFPGPNVAAFVAAGGSDGPAPPAPSPPAGNGNTSAPAPSPSAGNGNTGAPAPSPAPGNNTPTTTQPAPAPVKTGKSGSCKLKKKRSAEASASPSAEAMVEAVVESFKPRHLSRVMRRLAFDVSH